MVEAKGLTRRYGDLLAVDHLELSIGRGEVVGLLGPNGAGKTTTIRMLTGFLPASEGTVTVAGYDVRRSPVAARRHIGYMPENNPLYPEMRTAEYLAFRAELKGIARARRRRRIAKCIELCNLAGVAGQIIGALSKGYRQRVGLADAMLAEPDALILDEPTIGLDPNQVRDVRRLVRDLGERHTVLISTHILAEAEAICQRVLIIDKGRIVADDTPRALSERLLQGAVCVELQGDAPRIEETLARLPGVQNVQGEKSNGWHRFTLAAAPGADVRADVFRAAAENGWTLRELTRRRPSLEDVFRRLTLGPEPGEERRP
ncbi:MAG: ATP-binding cassette domain-containing protein [Planctomycetes bacterium]|nr:ATP-binding cassette domain-containing protein [Planctomycetota bacterium]